MRPNSLGAERGAHRELASSSGGAGQHQIREVRACDDEHQSHGGNEQESGGREGFVKVGIDAHVARGNDADGFLAHRLGILFSEPLHKTVKLGANLRRLHAGLHATFHPQPRLGATIEPCCADQGTSRSLIAK
jgi:hypothetical protein